MMKQRKLEVVERNKKLNSPQLKRWKALLFNRYFFSIFSGMAVGVIFGLISLNLLTENGQPISADKKVQQTMTNHAANDETGLTETVRVDDLYVIQLGLFNDMKNAEAARAFFSDKRIAATIWPEGDQYYIFHGIFANAEKAKAKQEALMNDDVESFVKTWSIEMTIQNANEDELKRIQSLFDLWKHSLEQVDAEKDFPVDEWNEWLESGSSQSSLMERIHEHVSQMLDERSQHERAKLLDLMVDVKSMLQS